MLAIRGPRVATVDWRTHTLIAETPLRLTGKPSFHLLGLPNIRPLSGTSLLAMKRKEAPTKASKSSARKARPEVLEYHLAPSVHEADGSIQWPAPSFQINRAREIIRQCAAAGKTTLVVPDKDADGLSAGAILRHTLILLGLREDLIKVHLLSKGTTVHSEDERSKMAAHEPSFVFVIDHGSRASPALVRDTVATLIIDHHHATERDFPAGSEHVSACESPPVATSALLTYEICEPLHDDVRDKCAWLCVVGTHGDLGNTIKWEEPFPDMKDVLKKHSKKVLNDVVSLVNAPRRTAKYDVLSAWTALCDTSEPRSILDDKRLKSARAEINEEVERVTHTAPKFSRDGKIAVFRISSKAQVHPVIATRWAGHLNSKALEVVMVANSGYLPGKVRKCWFVGRGERRPGHRHSLFASCNHCSIMAYR
ncbi:DHH phosphoesterase [Teratosphaeria nubilosa]|uniref:DHH phosphoesterase n=1 Tax=Teratosphaeria nubilosa TaxID=161662 RepID=A0A6G1LEX9_9PEZI|nr:DHH phosphoesterase [Teratosphaeria nubilosa]